MRAECMRCHQVVPLLPDGKLVTHSTPSGERTCNCIEPSKRQRKLTIYEVLREKLGREPTHAELCADVRRILRDKT